MAKDLNEVIKPLLEQWATEFTAEIRANLVSKDAWYDSSTLAQSIAILPIKNVNGGYVITIQMPEYAKYLDKGVKGSKESSKAPNSPYQYANKMPPVDKIQLWISKRAFVKLELSDKNKSLHEKLKSKKVKKAFKQRTLNSQYRSLAFAISHGIKNKGIKATNFYSDIFNDEKLTELSKRLEPLLGEQIEVQLIEGVE